MDQLLKARETRGRLRRQAGVPFLTLSMNVPGFPKVTPVIESAFKHVIKDVLSLFEPLVKASDPVYMGLEDSYVSNLVFNAADTLIDFSNKPIVTCDSAGWYMAVPIRDKFNMDAKQLNTGAQYVDRLNEDLSLLKEMAWTFEEVHGLGRFCDLDVYDSSGMPVGYIPPSESAVFFKEKEIFSKDKEMNRQRPCFICERPARVCMKEQSHSMEELRNYIERDCSGYLLHDSAQAKADYLAVRAVRALIEEVMLDPKPGLVTAVSSGPHPDMNAELFIKSAAALMPGFKEMANMALIKDIPIHEQLLQMRKIGLEMEKNMAAATNGINTHKGAIFIMGLMVWSAAQSIRCNDSIDPCFISQHIQAMCKGLTLELSNPDLVNRNERDLKNNTDCELKTHGMQMFQRYGVTGARGEAENGFPMVFQHTLPAIFSLSKQSMSKAILAKTMLLMIMSKNNDSTTLYRCGMEMLTYIQTESLKILELSLDTQEGKQAYESLCAYCTENHVSCGGSADLLSAGLFLLTLISKD
ncbi:triphosphoribosyl-dephospho-CoA synthase [Thermoproteota archaeon]